MGKLRKKRVAMRDRAPNCSRDDQIQGGSNTADGTKAIMSIQVAGEVFCVVTVEPTVPMESMSSQFPFTKGTPRRRRQVKGYLSSQISVQ